MGRGLDRGRSANEPENVPQHNTNKTAAKDSPKHFTSVTKPRKLKIRARRIPCSSVEQATEQAKEGEQHQYLLRVQSYNNLVL